MFLPYLIPGAIFLGTVGLVLYCVFRDQDKPFRLGRNHKRVK